MKKTSFNDGYTMMETLISISIIGMLLVPASMVTKQNYTIARMKDKVKLIEKIIKNENTIRSAIEERKIPFWDREFYVTFEKNTIFMNGLYFSETKLDDDVEITETELLGDFPYAGIEVKWRLCKRNFSTKANFMGTTSDD